MDILEDDEPSGEKLLDQMCARGEREYEATRASFQSLTERISAILAGFGAQIAQVRLYDSQLWNHPDARQAQWFRQLSSHPTWTHVCRVLYFICSLQFSTVMVLQYYHDIQLLRLRQALVARPQESLDSLAARAASLSGEPANGPPSEPHSGLLISFANIRFWLEYLGAPYRDLTLMIELVYLIMVWFSWHIYLRPYLVHKYLGPFDFAAARMMDDHARERRLYTQITIQVLQQCAASSRERSCRAMSTLSSERRLHAMRQHSKAVKLFRQLAINGQLEPDSRSAKQMAQLGLVRASIMLTLIVMVGSLLLLLMLFVPSVTDYYTVNQLHLDGPDIFAHTLYLMMALLIVVMVMFYMSAASVIIIDRLWLTKTLERRVRRCIAAGNDLLAYNWTRPTSGCLFEPFNELVTLVLIHYKCAVAHVKPSQWTLSTLCLMMMEVLVIGPVAGSLHAPFFHEQIAPLMFSSLFIACASVDICLVPVCQLHSRASNLYSSMSSLMAILAELELRWGHVQDPCDPNIVWLLRAELARPDLFISRLSVSVVGKELNYTRFMRLHFWAGLILCLATITAKNTIENTGQLTNPFRFVF